LVREYGGKVMPFRDLPIPAQLAIAHYMAIDGEAWGFPEGTANWSVSSVKKELPAMLPYFRKVYGGQRFGYVMIPMEALKESILKDQWLTEDVGIFPSYEVYDEHVHSQAGFRPTEHPTTQRWPVILSSENEETLQDGWHRLHAYYHQGAKLIPAVYYP
jgi:hypothetical protein